MGIWKKHLILSYLFNENQSSCDVPSIIMINRKFWGKTQNHVLHWRWIFARILKIKNIICFLLIYFLLSVSFWVGLKLLIYGRIFNDTFFISFFDVIRDIFYGCQFLFYQEKKLVSRNTQKSKHSKVSRIRLIKKMRAENCRLLIVARILFIVVSNQIWW